MLALRSELRRIRPSKMIYLADRPAAASVFRDFAFFKAAGVPKIIAGPWSRDLRVCRIDRLTSEFEYESQRLARMLKQVAPVNLAPADWDLRLSASEIARVDAQIDAITGAVALLAISPGAKIPAKDWGADRWSSLLTSLAHDYRDIALVIVGAPDERELCNQLAYKWAGPVLNLCGTVTPRETAAALRRCQLMVCHDSGPMHLAASQGTRCVALFGNYNRPRRWYPYGPDHRVIHEPRGVREISVPRVANEIRTMLNNLPKRSLIQNAEG
jgi:heptosyltransferase-3